MIEQIIEEVEQTALVMMLNHKSHDDIIWYIESRDDLTSAEIDVMIKDLNL